MIARLAGRSGLRGLALLATGAGLGAAAHAAWGGAGAGREHVSTASCETAVAEVAASSPLRDRRDMREAVQRAMIAARAIQPAQIEQAMADLETQARARGYATALEVEPAMAMAMSNDAPEMAAAFAKRMRELSEASHPELAEATGEANPEALERIVHSAGEEKQRHIRQYIESAQRLSPEEAATRLASLNSAAASASAADRAALDNLGARIQSADGATRGALVRSWMELVQQLPEEERASRIATLNRQVGVGAPAASSSRSGADPG